LEFRSDWSFSVAFGFVVCPTLSAPVVSFESGILAIYARFGTISFDKDKKQLVKTYRAGLNLVAPTVTLDLMEPREPATPSAH